MTRDPRAGAGRLLFFGTPQFAVPSLEALAAAGRPPLLVVTQPARPAGRGRRRREPPVAAAATRLRLEVAAVESVRAPEFLARVRELEPDLAAVVAFGQIFPQELLSLPRLGCVNLHASLLPAFRGAAPVQAAILSGAEETGVTTMLMDEGLDTGPILLQRRTPIGPWETAGELAARLAWMGGELLVETVEGLEAGTVEPHTQEPGQASVAPRLRRQDARVDWRRSAVEIFRRLRAYTPWPGLATTLRNEPLKIIWGEPLAEHGQGWAAGAFVGLRNGRLAVACGDATSFGIERLQRPGRRVVTAREFVNGVQLQEGERFE